MKSCLIDFYDIRAMIMVCNAMFYWLLNRLHGENQRPAAYHSPTLLHNVKSSTSLPDRNSSSQV